VRAARRELEERGFRLHVRNWTEPLSQVVIRLLSPEGLLVGGTVTPWMRGEKPWDGSARSSGLIQTQPDPRPDHGRAVITR